MTTENSVLNFHDWKQQQIEKEGGIKHRRDWYQAAYGRYVQEQKSVRVPREPTQKMMRAGADRWIEAIDEAVTRKGEEEAARCAWAAMLAAAPAPAGAQKAHRWNDDGETCLDCGDKDWMGGPCTPAKPEPDAGLPVAWYVFADTEHWVTLDKDEAERNRDAGCQVRPMIFGDAALARQQSRVEYRPIIVADEWTDAQCVAFMATGLRHVEYKRGNHGPTCDEIRQGVVAALRAALEGGRDGREAASA